MRILLAEDEVTIVVTLRDALEEAGHAVRHAPDTKDRKSTRLNSSHT